MSRLPPPRSGDPFGIRPTGSLIAPLVSVVVLAFIAIITIGLITGDVWVPGGGDGPGAGPISGPRTPAPSDIVVVDPRTNVPGSIAYVKAGNLWLQSGAAARQLTSGGRDAMPAWSPDGRWIYFVRTRPLEARWRIDGASRRFEMEVPALYRVRPEGGAEEPLLDGLMSRGDERWFYWIREPAPAPDGQTIAIVSDGPDPAASDLVVQLLDLQTGEVRTPDLPQVRPLGHQGLAWRPDGRLLLFVRNARDGAVGAPTIERYDPTVERWSTLSGPGYVAPAWSPDGRFVAATRTSAFGTNVVILDAASGGELLRLTTDDRSWSPVWSPAGDAIAYLHRAGGIVDLRLVRLGGAGPDWTVTERIDLTEASGLDEVSRPSWWIPPELLPTATAIPSAPTGAPAPSPSPSPSPVP